MTSPVIVDELPGATVVRFARPEIRNPMSIEVLEFLNALLDNLGSRPLIFTGQNNVFASGADLREISKVAAQDATAFARRGQDLMKRIEDLPQTTLAAVNGYCFGGALDLALACDRRLASPNARFAHPGTGLGIITGWGGTQRLPRLVGTANALEMFFSAEPINAELALRIGLVDQVADDPLAAARKFVG